MALRRSISDDICFSSTVYLSDELFECRAIARHNLISSVTVILDDAFGGDEWQLIREKAINLSAHISRGCDWNILTDMIKRLADAALQLEILGHRHDVKAFPY